MNQELDIARYLNTPASRHYTAFTGAGEFSEQEITGRIVSVVNDCEDYGCMVLGGAVHVWSAKTFSPDNLVQPGYEGEVTNVSLFRLRPSMLTPFLSRNIEIATDRHLKNEVARTEGRPLLEAVVNEFRPASEDGGIVFKGALDPYIPEYTVLWR